MGLLVTFSKLGLSIAALLVAPLAFVNAVIAGSFIAVLLIFLLMTGVWAGYQQ